ncbi:MAG: hypothetical protein KBB14_11755 [Thermoanaerobaculia bacterium]|nr:hypothetical protein [Thermoanaerobaculia bacterium]
MRAVADDVTANTAAALADSAVRERHETYLCGVVILMTGYFETFLKEAVRLFVGHVSRSGKPFVSLPTKMKDHHYEGGARVLTEVTRASGKAGPPKWAASASDVVDRLHSVAASATYAILWEAFADTRANPTDDVVSELLSRLCINDPWRKIEQHTGALKAAHLRANLNSLVGTRNACAHTGTMTPPPTSGTVIEHIDCLTAIALGIAAVLEAEAKRY